MPRPRPRRRRHLTADDLPIADYDFLGVSEILPLLSELDPDELEQVREYEEGRSGPGHGPRPDRHLAGRGRRARARAAGCEPEPGPNPQRRQRPAPEPAGSGFPIASYDKLRVFQILLLLPELDDERARKQCAQYEQAGRGRVTITQPDRWPTRGWRARGRGPASPRRLPPPRRQPPPPQPPAPPAPAAPRRCRRRTPPTCPIADYDDLTQVEIIALLDELYDDELEEVRDYEDANRARAAILYQIEHAAGLSAPEARAEPEPEPEPEPNPSPSRNRSRSRNREAGGRDVGRAAHRRLRRLDPG